MSMGYCGGEAGAFHWAQLGRLELVQEMMTLAFARTLR